MLGRFLAKELSYPSNLVGQLILAPLWNRRNAALNDMVFEIMELSQDDSVLDVGFGGGYLLGKILDAAPNGHIAGIDRSPVMVKSCQRRYRAQIRNQRLLLHCGKAESLPFDDASFSKACSVNSIFYWDDVESAFSEVWRVLQPSGTFVVCFTDPSSLESKSFTRHGVTLFHVDQVHQMLEGAGFSVGRPTQGADRHREFWCSVASK
jgi:ubiquinone/menaquinone biosynthesis C-methylase UbiE